MKWPKSIQLERTSADGKERTPSVYHMALIRNPVTGKTTTGRLFPGLCKYIYIIRLYVYTTSLPCVSSMCNRVPRASIEKHGCPGLGHAFDYII